MYIIQNKKIVDLFLPISFKLLMGRDRSRIQALDVFVVAEEDFGRFHLEDVWKEKQVKFNLVKEKQIAAQRSLLIVIMEIVIIPLIL